MVLDHEAVARLRESVPIAGVLGRERAHQGLAAMVDRRYVQRSHAAGGGPPQEKLLGRRRARARDVEPGLAAHRRGRGDFLGLQVVSLALEDDGVDLVLPQRAVERVVRANVLEARVAVGVERAIERRPLQLIGLCARGWDAAPERLAE